MSRRYTGALNALASLVNFAEAGVPYDNANEMYLVQEQLQRLAENMLSW